MDSNTIYNFFSYNYYYFLFLTYIFPLLILLFLFLIVRYLSKINSKINFFDQNNISASYENEIETLMNTDNNISEKKGKTLYELTLVPALIMLVIFLIMFFVALFSSL